MLLKLFQTAQLERHFSWHHSSKRRLQLRFSILCFRSIVPDCGEKQLGIVEGLLSSMGMEVIVERRCNLRSVGESFLCFLN